MVSKSVLSRLNVPAELEAWVAYRLINTHIRASRAMALGLLLNLIVIILAVGSSIALPVFAYFVIASLIGISHRLWLANGIARDKRRRHAEKLQYFFTLNSIWQGAHMGALVAIALPQVSSIAQIIMVLSIATQFGALAYTSRTLPVAALWHIGALGLGLSVGLAQLMTPLAWLGVVLIIAANLVQANMVKVAHKSFVDRIINDRELSESLSTVKMLLNDFESQGSDWIFELDHHGRIVAANSRFAAASNLSIAELNGRDFFSLFRDGSSNKELSYGITNREVCRDLVLRLQDNQSADERWWSVSMRPLADSIISGSRFRGVISDISSEKQAEARAYHMANFDSLTELPNRLMFNTSLSQKFRDEQSYCRIALLMIDCDHFKSVNDMYGHPVGDKYLKAVAARMVETLDESGLGFESRMIARLGGDEFAVMLDGEDVGDKSIRLAELLVTALKQPFRVDDHEIIGGVSIGLALAPDHAVSANGLISNADIALYAAKDAGRGLWEMFMPGMDEELHKRHALARDLRTAVPNGELRLFLQPLVNVESGQHVGFEALVRWQHPEHGMVMPNDFIPIAEETGLIVQMGEWIIRTALAEAASWADPHSIAINLSPIQLQSPNLIPTIMNALGETGVDPGRIELEITESVLMKDSEANIAVLNKLHSLGIKIALDDFGTGYASLNYLLTFPFDKVKIDRSFVNDLESKAEARSIVGAVIRLANELGICTLAEGVEHEDQLQHLRQQGCDMVQGWLFGKAMPADHYFQTQRVLQKTAA